MSETTRTPLTLAEVKQRLATCDANYAGDEFATMRRDTLQSILHYLAALPADAPPRLSEAEWQPIETAPKDGTPIIVVTADEGRVCQAYWEDSVWHTGWVEYCHRSDIDPVEPTMWQPLPAPPAALFPESPKETD